MTGKSPLNGISLMGLLEPSGRASKVVIGRSQVRLLGALGLCRSLPERNRCLAIKLQSLQDGLDASKIPL